MGATEYRERCSLWFDEATLQQGDPGQSLRHDRAEDSLSAEPTLSTTLNEDAITEGPEPAENEAPPSPSLELLKEIGRGGMGAVHEARQGRLRRSVAVKTALDSAPRLRERFLAEAYVTAALDHPNIVPVYDLDLTASGKPALAMKLVRGVEWRRLLKPRDDEDRARAEDLGLVGQLELLIQVGHALAFAHSKGVIHCDIKPDNVMVGDYGEVFLMDWGAAVSVAPPPEPGPWAPANVSITSPLGTPRYMAPELAEGEGHRIDERTDVYLLGACLYEVLTGDAPHRGDSLLQVLAAACQGRPPDFEGREVSEEAAAICARAMAAEPAERYANVKELQKAIREHLRHRESQEACARAEQMLEDCTAEPEDATPLARDQLYSRFADAIAGFQQAGLTWKGNVRAQEGELRARRAYARAALARGDIAFAASQAARLPRSDAALREEVERASRARERTQRAARRLRQTIIGGVAIIVLGLATSLILIDAERREVSAAKQVISEQYAKLLRLSDAKRLAQLRSEESALWPAWQGREEKVASWLRRATELEGNHTSHEANLKAMRALALPYSAADRRANYEAHPDRERAAMLEAHRANLRRALAAFDGGDAPFPKIAGLRRLFTRPENDLVAEEFPRRFIEAESRLRALMVGQLITRALSLDKDGEAFDVLDGLGAALGRLARREAEDLRAQEREVQGALNALDPKRRKAARALRRALAAYEFGDRDALQGGYEAIAEDFLPRFNGWLLQTLNIRDPEEAGAAYEALSDEDRASVIARVYRGLLAEFERDMGSGLTRLKSACAALRAALIDSYRRRELVAFRRSGEELCEAIARRVEALEARSQERSRWRFAELGAQWEHDLLAELVADLRRFSRQVLEPTRARLEDFRRWRARSLVEAAPRWREARAAIAGSARYRGLTLVPQEGLVPIGADPSSGLWEFAVLGTGAVPRRSADGRLIPESDDAVVLVLIPGGDFIMGGDREIEEDSAEANRDLYATDDEGPCRRVSLDAYFIAKHELSQAQWRRMTGANPSEFYPGKITHTLAAFSPRSPVETVNWREAHEALRRAGLRLPTEAQWERAARGGTRSPWWTGTRIYDCDGALNIADRSYHEATSGQVSTAWSFDGFVFHAPIGSFPANPFGLHEVLGNVSEWCADASVSLLTRPRPGDGLLSSGPSTLRVHRGGSFVREARSTRAASREAAPWTLRSRALGLRAARPLISKESP